jgi:hypothetical protein
MEGFHRPQGYAQGFCDLIIMELVEMAHDEDRTLPLGEPVHAAGQDVFKIAGPLGSLAPGVGDIEFFYGFQAFQLAPFVVVLAIKINAQVLSDLKEPGFKIVAAAKRADFQVELHEGLLDKVEGIFLVPEKRIGQDKDFFLVHSREGHKSFPVSLFDSLNQSPSDILIIGVGIFHGPL